MGYETLCLLCGVSPGGGCISICASDDVSENAEELTNEIQGSFDHSVDIHEVVREVLELTANENFQRHSSLPDGVGGGHYNESDYHIVIGYFDQDGEPITRGRESKRIGPDGKRVVIRQTAGGGVNGIFREVLAVVNGENELGISLSTSAYKSEFNPCFALHEPCYFFLKAWLDRDQLPPRSCAFPSDPEPLSFASELYEIVNSQEETRDDAFKGCLLSSAIDYEGIQDTLIYYQDFFINGRKDAKHLIQAIQAGLRGAELIPALYRDCRVYMFMRPNKYPEPSLAVAPAKDRPSFTIYPHETALPLPAIARLPTELYFVMLRDLPLLSLLTLASTCRSLRFMILDPPFFDRLLKETIMGGALRWLLPVDGVLNDSRKEYDALWLWLPADCRPPPYTVNAADPTDANNSEQAGNSHKAAISSSPVPPVEPLIMSPQFPALAFVRACWESDSMMNRKRLWGQVKQFEELWRYYRVHGWRVNRFFPSSELVVHSEDPLVLEQPRT